MKIFEKNMLVIFLIEFLYKKDVLEKIKFLSKRKLIILLLMGMFLKRGRG